MFQATQKLKSINCWYSLILYFETKEAAFVACMVTRFNVYNYFCFTAYCDTIIFLNLVFECGDNFTGTEGEFSSPGYPLTNYPSNIQCTWTVSTTEGSRIGIYHSNLDIEYHPSCDKDYLMVSSRRH